MIKAAIFDFDGTLTELTLDFAALRAAMEEVARRYIGDDVIERQRHQYIVEMVYAIEEALGDSGPSFRDEALKRLTDLEVEAAHGKEVYPFTRDVLRTLRDKGVKVGIITRNTIEAVRLIFPDAGEYVEAMVTREHTRQLKPNPVQVTMALSLLGVEPHEAVVVGDHPSDIKAGRAAGTGTVAVLTGRTTREALEESAADYILQDIRGLTSII